MTNQIDSMVIDPRIDGIQEELRKVNQDVERLTDELSILRNQNKVQQGTLGQNDRTSAGFVRIYYFLFQERNILLILGVHQKL